MKKVVSFLVLVVYSTYLTLINLNFINISYALETNEQAIPWTMDKAEHLARKTLYSVNPEIVQQLYQAGTAQNAVNILFPSEEGPDRAQFEAELNGFMGDDFDISNRNVMYKYYQYKKYRDPYEAKSKLHSLFEDIFSVDYTHNKIYYHDLEQLHNLLFEHTLGNYKQMVKNVLYNDDNNGDYAAGAYLDLFNQQNIDRPNENYARELLQLFLMLEYKPYEGVEDEGAVRNYTEDDVAALAKIITGLEADDVTHEVNFNPDNHNKSTDIEFLTGDLKQGDSFPFYNSLSGTLNLEMMENSINGNNGLPDNTIDYIFSKREYEIALFLGDRLFRFYVHGSPIKSDIEAVADEIVANNFEILPTVKFLLASDMMYSDKSMNSTYYKNPLELAIGTLKLLHYKNPENIDPSIYDQNLLNNIERTPYLPRSIFGRDGFDSNAKWMDSYIHNQWVTMAFDIAYDNGEGRFDMDDILTQNRTLEQEGVYFEESNENNYTGSIDILSGTIVFSDPNGTFSGGVQTGNMVTITSNTGFVNFPTFDIVFSGYNLDVFSGQVDFESDSMELFSGVLDDGDNEYSIVSGQFVVGSDSILYRDVNEEETLTQFENYFLMGRPLPENVRNNLKTFLTTDNEGNSIKFQPNDENYRKNYLRGLVAMILVQPEYMMNNGFDQPTIQSDLSESDLAGSDNKLIFVELFGGYDWMNGIIPKDEYDLYVEKRGVLAEGEDGLIDIGDYYMSSNLSSFKPLFDSGNLRLINRVGTPYHSRGHDSAQRQITSFQGVQESYADGFIGRLIEEELDSTNHISLGSGMPNIYRYGRFINIGGNSADYIHRGSISADYKTHQLDSIKHLLNSREYPGEVKPIFVNSVKIDGVATKSKESGGRGGSGYRLNEKFEFLELLLDDGLGVTYYVPGGGGYDTHSNQITEDPDDTDLGTRIKGVADDVSEFFNTVKNDHNVTIVIFSEFGRTIKTNGSNGTDHGKGGGYFILTNNNSFQNNMPEKVYGNISLSKELNNWFEVGIDYRTIFVKIFDSLYGIDGNAYFNSGLNQADQRDFILENYVDEISPDPVLLNHSFVGRSSSHIRFDLEFGVEDKNFFYDQASYVDLYYGNNPDELKQYSRWRMDNYGYNAETGKVGVSFDWISEKTDYYYEAHILDNQYNEYILSGHIVVPDNLPTTQTNILHDYNSMLRKYNNTLVSGNTDIDDILIADAGTGSTYQFTGHDGVIVTASGTGQTLVESLFSDQEITWNGGFVLPYEIEQDKFISENSTFNWNKLSELDILKIIKIGADKRGVGMKLNKPVSLTVPVGNADQKYAVIKSEDGLNWTGLVDNYVEREGTNINFDVSTFSYFAVVPVDDIVCEIDVDKNKVQLGDEVNVTWSSEGGSFQNINQGIGDVNDSGTTEIVLNKTGLNVISMEVGNTFYTERCSDNVVVVPKFHKINNFETINGSGTNINGKPIIDLFKNQGFSGDNYMKKSFSGDFVGFFEDGIVGEDGTDLASISFQSGTNLYFTDAFTGNFVKRRINGNIQFDVGNIRKLFKNIIEIGDDEPIILDQYLTIVLYSIGNIDKFAYRVNDGDDWTELLLSNGICEPEVGGICGYVQNGNLYIRTYHLTQFATLNETELESDDDTGGSSGGGGSGGGGGGGGGGGSSYYYMTKIDDCPKGDYSGNFYDKKCLKPEKAENKQENNKNEENDTEVKLDKNKDSSKKVIKEKIEVLDDAEIDRQFIENYFGYGKYSKVNSYIFKLSESYEKMGLGEDLNDEFVRLYGKFLVDLVNYKNGFVNKSLVVKTMNDFIKVYENISNKIKNGNRLKESISGVYYSGVVGLENEQLYFLENSFEGVKNMIMDKPLKYSMSDYYKLVEVKKDIENLMIKLSFKNLNSTQINNEIINIRRKLDGI